MTRNSKVTKNKKQAKRRNKLQNKRSSLKKKTVNIANQQPKNSQKRKR